MRALAVALLLSVPLSAGDRASLEKAVELFRSPDPGKREAGSQLAERELRKLLAPLFKAMQDDDPEVRRRARRSILSLVEKRIREGTFKFHYRQGFSFKRGEVVDASEADVVLTRCAGGISSIELTAPGGIMNLERLLGRRRTGLAPNALFHAIAMADPNRLQLAARADGDSRSPESDVFLLRTRDGGWAKLCIDHRGTERGWQHRLATIRYSYNPDKPFFIAVDKPAEAVGGVVFVRELKAGPLEVAQQRAAAKAAAAPRLGRAQGGGVVPDPGKTQEVLLARARFHNYEKCTFSFRHAVRDDPGLRLTRNNWDLQFGNGGDVFHVCMVTDDRSTITDLGEGTWQALANRKQVEEGTGSRVNAEHEHIYLVHTQDRGSQYFSFVRVAAIRPGVACLIEWVSLQGAKLETSPGLEVSDKERASLKRLLGVRTERTDAEAKDR